MLQHQFRQLNKLLRHACETVPYYREVFGSAGFDPQCALTPKSFSRLPLLQRSDIQSYGERLFSRQMPSGHGKTVEVRTSGSSGAPIRTLGTDITQFFWRAFTLRDHLWHKRDLSAKLAAIRNDVPDGVAQGWGPSTDVVFNTGPCAMLHIKADIDMQIEWLKKQNPEYLISFPSNIYALAKQCMAGSVSIPNLREVRTFGEALNADLRSLCKQAWGVKLTDIYSSQEAGYIALECPEYGHYHVQSEGVIVEILNEEGRQCSPGETGRVVITTLHNFAAPLIRYEILDYAEVGGPCPCGRGLPVLKSIMGRERNMLTLPDGKRFWPSFPAPKWDHIAPIRQIQLVQREPDLIIVRLVSDRHLDKNEETKFTKVLHGLFGYPFRLVFEYHEKIRHKSNYKYEDFISELS